MKMRLVPFCLASIAAAGDLSGLYPAAKLATEKPRFEKRLNEMLGIFENATNAILLPEEIARLHGVQLAFPLLGVGGDPMDYHSAGQTVTLPVESLLFFEDLCTAYAWLWQNHYRMEVIEDYVTMLRYRGPDAFAGGRYPPPLVAMRIPQNAWDDRQVNDLSLRFRNSAYAFILGHELAHIFYRHPAQRPTAEVSRRYEEEADAFALELMRRSATIPMGAMLFFEVSTYYLPNLAQGRSIEKEAGHPLNAHRLQAIASQLEQNASDYARLSPTKTTEIASVKFIASGFQKFARELNDPEFQTAIVAHAAKLDAADLAKR
jgi:hypothetical protein